MAETKHYTLKDLEKFYKEDESCDKSVFSEMRSNILLNAGEHFNKKDSDFFRRIRSANDIPDEQKIRLTKNHIQKICKVYSNHISSSAPGVGFKPKNPGELQDQKSAEMHDAVWKHLTQKYNLDETKEEEIDNFIVVGEIACKIFYDQSKGPRVGFEAAVDEQGQPVVDPQTGQPVPDQAKPVHRGEFVFEPIYGFNLLKPPEAVDFRSSERLTIRKMVSLDALKASFPDSADQIRTSQKETFVVFDPAQSGYRSSENESVVMETYFRPCQKYPNGYFFIRTKDVILAEGELPGGLFPIVVACFEKYQTTARGRSPIKTMRPYQVEINRAASKIAEHQITLGDDKLVLINGSKTSAGMATPGIRTVSITGQEPVVIAGRDGSQYLAVMQQTIDELYKVMMVDEIEQPSEGQQDPFAMLFQAASKKRHFQRYISRFERYLIDKCKLTLSLAKKFLPDDEVILAVGKNEQVNIAEFKNSHDLNYEVFVEAQSEDLEKKLGAQMAINQVIQYVGNKLEKEDIGKLLRNMPYGNFEKDFEDWTLPYDSGTNLILALDRGEQPIINEFDDPVYMVKRLVSRMRQADFKTMPEQIQGMYQQVVAQYEQIQAMQIEKLQSAQKGLIPTGGYMVTCDIYVSDPADPNKTRRARIPYEAVEWLIQQLEVQGKTLSQLEGMNQAAMGQMSDMLQARQAQPTANGMAPAATNPDAGMSGKDSMYGRLSQLSGNYKH